MKYLVAANLCNGYDYVEHWEVGPFTDLRTAVEVWKSYAPPQDEVKAVVEELDERDDLEMQIGVWDENGDTPAFDTYAVYEDGSW